MTGNHQSKSNKVFGVLGVIANLGIARIAPQTSVRHLVDALENPNEDVSMAAYMALVKLGKKYAKVALLSRAGQPLSTSVLQVLGDMGDTDLIPELEPFAQSADENLAAAARESIAALHELDNDT